MEEGHTCEVFSRRSALLNKLRFLERPRITVHAPQSMTTALRDYESCDFNLGCVFSLPNEFSRGIFRVKRTSLFLNTSTPFHAFLP